MPFQPDAGAIVWRLHLRSAPERVYELLATDAGRASFWAEDAPERNGAVHFHFVNGMRYEGRVLVAAPPERWSVDYFESTAEFTLEPDGSGGTDLTLRNTGVLEADRVEVTAGWLNVLFPLKAVADFGVDLRSHDPTRTWELGYCDQ
jgi:uncharacterized protein YndB with AHSA1/START domain